MEAEQNNGCQAGGWGKQGDISQRVLSFSFAR